MFIALATSQSSASVPVNRFLKVMWSVKRNFVHGEPSSRVIALNEDFEGLKPPYISFHLDM